MLIALNDLIAQLKSGESKLTMTKLKGDLFSLVYVVILNPFQNLSFVFALVFAFAFNIPTLRK